MSHRSSCAITRDRPCDCGAELKPLPLSFDADSCEQRALRAEAQASVLRREVSTLRGELRAVDLALRAEGTPRDLTRMGRVRSIADRASRAERALAAKG